MAETLPLPLASSRRRYRLDDLEVDLLRGEIRRGRHATPLNGQPLEILEVLLTHPDRLVRREELQAKLWPGDAIGDLDQRLNAAMRLLRRALGDSTEEPRYIETLRGRGYRLCAAVEALEAPTGTGAGSASVTAEAGRAARILAIGAMLLATLVGALLIIDSSPPRIAEDTADGPMRIALAPIETIGDVDGARVLAASLDEALTMRVARIAPTRLAVLGRTSSRRLAEDRDALGEAPARWLLRGSLAPTETGPTLYLHLHELAEDTVVWSGSFDARRPVDAWFDAFSAVVAERAGLSATRPSPGTDDAEAYAAYLEALSVMEAGAEGSAEALLVRALEVDGDFVEARIQLGRLRSDQGDDAGAEEAFRSALARDPGSADAHLGLADTRFFGAWDWAGARGAYGRAGEAAPGRSDVQHARAWFQLADGDPAAAQRTMRHALALDPLNPHLHSDLGWFHYRSRDFAGALTVCHAALTRDAALRSALDCRHRALARLGRFEEARDRALETASLPAEALEALRAMPAEAGYAALLQRLVDEEIPAEQRLLRAMNLVAASRPERALEELEAGVRERHALLVLVDATPEFDALARLPRFQAIRRAVRGTDP